MGLKEWIFHTEPPSQTGISKKDILAAQNKRMTEAVNRINTTGFADPSENQLMRNVVFHLSEMMKPVGQRDLSCVKDYRTATYTWGNEGITKIASAWISQDAINKRENRK